MTSRSLRLRLLLGATGAIFLALAVSWFALTLLFERHIERQAVANLKDDARQLIGGLSLAPGGELATSSTPSDTRFAKPAGGLYWQLSAHARTVQSASLWDQHLPQASLSLSQGANDGWQSRVADGPFDQQLLLVERMVQPDSTGPEVLIQIAQDRSDIRAASRTFSRELALYLLVLWAVLALAAWVQVHLGLRPLQRLRSELAALRSSPSARLAEEHPAEVQPLAEAINELADARENDLGAARRRAADLAHGLKTPLAALAAQSRRARDAGAETAADGLDHAIAAVSAAVNAELARGRVARARGASGNTEAAVGPAAERVVAVVERADFGADRVFEVNVPDDLTVPLAQEDLAELLGTLIENATRHARRRVRITGERISTGDGVTRQVIVEDDGRGLDAASAAAVLARGARLDESGPGHGLGLSIAHELLQATGGRLQIDTGELGGLRATACWPATSD